jgi:hypothetical protein
VDENNRFIFDSETVSKNDKSLLKEYYKGIREAIIELYDLYKSSSKNGSELYSMLAN